MAFFTVTRDGDVSNSLRTGVMYLEDTIEQVSRQLLVISNVYTALYTRGSNSYTLHNLDTILSIKMLFYVYSNISCSKRFAL